MILFPGLSLRPGECDRLPDLSLRSLALPLGELAAQPPERENQPSPCLLLPFKSACKALSVTFGDSSPSGRAKDASLLAMAQMEASPAKGARKSVPYL